MTLEVYPIGVFGEMYQFDQSNTINMATKDVWYTIDNMNAGELQEVEFQNGEELKILRPGRYKVNYGICWTDGTNTVYKFRVAVNGTTVGKSQSCSRKGTATDVISTSSNLILDLAENDIVTMEVLNATNTNDIIIIDINASINLIE